MPGKRHSDAEIAEILHSWEVSGMTADEIAKKHKVTVQSLYRWKRLAKSGRSSNSKLASGDRSLRKSSARRAETLEELRAENARLKAVIADLLMEKYNAA